MPSDELTPVPVQMNCPFVESTCTSVSTNKFETLLLLQNKILSAKVRTGELSTRMTSLAVIRQPFNLSKVYETLNRPGPLITGEKSPLTGSTPMPEYTPPPG